MQLGTGIPHSCQTFVLAFAGHMHSYIVEHGLQEAARGPLLRPHYDWPAALEVLQAGWGEQLVRPKCCESREEMQSTPDGIYVLDVATGRRAEGPVV